MDRSIPSAAVCWGELLWDLFPSGACLGGAPSNVAMHLAANSVATTLVTRLGYDELGHKAERVLHERGVDVSGLQWDQALPTGRVGIEVQKGEARYTLHPGAWQQLRCDQEAQRLVGQCQAFCFGSLSQESPVGLASWKQACALLPASCLRVCDPNLRGGRMDADLIRSHLEVANVVKLNDGEARVLSKAFGCYDLIPWLLDDLRVEVVALTHGAHGATLCTLGESRSHPGFPATPSGDNVGAGDSFTAVLIRGLLAKSRLSDIAEAANRYACFVASNRGATPTAPASLLAEVEALLAG